MLFCSFSVNILKVKKSIKPNQTTNNRLNQFNNIYNHNQRINIFILIFQISIIISINIQESQALKKDSDVKNDKKEEKNKVLNKWWNVKKKLWFNKEQREKESIKYKLSIKYFFDNKCLLNNQNPKRKRYEF